MNREELIKEALHAYHGVENRGQRWEWSPESITSMRAALAVFEQAHTPSDDERADMIAWLMRDQTNDLSPQGRDYTDAEIANALRRTVQGEPGTKRTGPCGFSLDQCRCELPAEHDGMHECSDHRISDRALWEPQGEPSSEVPEPSTELDDELRRERDHHGIDPEPQGEPSDAQVHAALSAYWGAMNVDEYGSVEGMRAALRAAGGVS